MPSIRLLSMVYDMSKSKHFKWIPWQLRLSARQCQEAVEARSHKAARTETQLLAHAFFDDAPEISVEGRTLTSGWLHRIQQVFRNALALCQAVHLLNAKALDQQIANMCLLQPDPALSLRTVTTSELLHADRQIWAPSLTYYNANGPWTMHSMSSHTAAWRYTPCSCFAQERADSPWRLLLPSAQPSSRIRRNHPEKRVKGRARGRPAIIGRQRIKASKSAADSNRASAKLTAVSSRMYAP